VTWRLGAFLLSLFLWTLGCPPARAELTLQVAPLGDARDIDFGPARSLGPHGEQEFDTVVRQVRLTITSDSGRPYQVLQRVNEPWRNLAGKELPLESVLFHISESTTAGENRFPNPTPLAVDERVIFISDPAGTSGELLLVYTVPVPLGQQTGNYKTTFSFRVVSQ